MKYIIVVLSLLGLSFFVILNYAESRWFSSNKIWLSYDITLGNADTLEVFYNNGKGFVANSKVLMSVVPSTKKTIEFPAINSTDLQEIRLDFGQFNKEIILSNAKIYSIVDTIDLLSNIHLLKSNCVGMKSLKNKDLRLTVDCMDPFLVYKGKLDSLKSNVYTKSDQKIIIGILGIYLIFIFIIIRFKIGYQLVHKHRFKDIAFLGGFLIFISFHWYSIASGNFGNDFTLERRLPAKFPESKDTVFIAHFEDWFNDNLQMRQTLIRSKSQISYFLFNKSALPTKVIAGANLELFPSSEFLIEDFKGGMILTNEQMASMQQIIHERIAYLKKQNADYYLMMPANKQTIYPQDLPSKIVHRHQPKKTMMSQLMLFLAKDSLIQAHLFDTRPTLQKASRHSTQRIYCKNDLHWNAYGAYYAYFDFMLKIALNHPELKPIPMNQFSIKRIVDKEGDLARMLLLHNQAHRELFEFKTSSAPSYTMKTIFGEHLFPIYQTKIKSSILPKALVFRDSFCQDMIQFLSLHFSEATYIWDQEFNDKLIKEKKPDVVIQEITEMFIYDLLRVNSKEVTNEK